MHKLLQYAEKEIIFGLCCFKVCASFFQIFQFSYGEVDVERTAECDVDAVTSVFMFSESISVVADVDGRDDVAVMHVPCGVSVEEACFFLELYDGNGLVHHGCEAFLLVVDCGFSVENDGFEAGAWVVAIVLHGESGERDEVDAVSFFERGEVGVSQADSYDVADTGVVSRSRSHPQDVVVAPLYVP